MIGSIRKCSNVIAALKKWSSVNTLQQSNHEPRVFSVLGPPQKSQARTQGTIHR